MIDPDRTEAESRDVETAAVQRTGSVGRWRILRLPNLIALGCLLLIPGIYCLDQIEGRFSRAAIVENQLLLVGEAFRSYANGSHGERYPNPAPDWRLTLPTAGEFVSAFKSLEGRKREPVIENYAGDIARIDLRRFPLGVFYYFGYMMVTPEQYEAYFDYCWNAIQLGERLPTEDIELTSVENRVGLGPFINCRATDVLGVPRALDEEARRDARLLDYYRKSGLYHVPELHRLREGVERFATGYIGGPGCPYARFVPVLIERPRRYAKGYGGHVLYRDGSVRFVAYPGDLPMTEAIWERVDELEALWGDR